MKNLCNGRLDGWLKNSGRLLVAIFAGAMVACGAGGSGSGTSGFGGGNGGTAPTGLVALSVVTDRASVANNSSDLVTVTVTALGSGNSALTNVEVPVQLRVDDGAVITASKGVTDKATGRMTATVQLVDRTNRTVKIRAASGNVTSEASFNVVDSLTGGKVADLVMSLDKLSVANDGSEQAVLSVTSLDSQRIAVGGAGVKFSVTDSQSAAYVVPAALVTDPTTGVLTGVVKVGATGVNRDIVLEAKSGTVTKQLTLRTSDPIKGAPNIKRLTLVLSKTSIQNTGSEFVEAVATAVDGYSQVVAGIDVRFSASNQTEMEVVNAKTDASGKAKAIIRIGADKTDRMVTVTASTASLPDPSSASFMITGTKLTGTLLPAKVKSGAPGVVEYQVVDAARNPIPGVGISVNGPAGDSAQGVSDSQGKYTYRYIAKGSGPQLISAAAPGNVSIQSTVQVDAAVAVVPDTVSIASATFTASPVVVKVNSPGSSENRVELRALFKDANNVPIPNVRARFGLGANLSGSDGVVSSGEDEIVVADSLGVALSSFVPGQRSSPTNQVLISMCFGKDDAVESVKTCPADRLRSTALTVVEEPVSISIGTNELIGIGSSKLTYIQEFTVLVVDAAGQPKADVQLSAVLDLPSYEKGRYVYAGTAWVRNAAAQCINEDNSDSGFRNNTIETVNGVSEDVNGNGALDPRKSDVSISFVGSTRTNASGLATLRIEYPMSLGSWVEYSLRVTASGVVSPPAIWGRQAKVSIKTVSGLVGTPRFLGVPLDVIKNEATPPFMLSPYGLLSDCTNPN
ncbi:hypothetical protein ACG0Z6_01385 [Roseateles sp. BYS180W]|uniref:Big-1 domain-containing protein n=1 Tax=Roseateles rivi TaxID=3299028 RepID=A0ABW7FRE4_9BURK